MPASTHELALVKSYINFLKAFWSNARVKGGITVAQLSQANEAMTYLVELGNVYADVRHAIAQAAIFETALFEEMSGGGAWGDLIPRDAARWAVDLSPDSDDAPTRLVLLDGILRFGGGTFWSIPDKAGVSPWLNDPDNAAAMVARTLVYDPLPAVQVAMLKILVNCAIPASWAKSTVSTFGAQASPSVIMGALGELQRALPVMYACPFDQSNEAGAKGARRPASFDAAGADACYEIPGGVRQVFSGLIDRAIGRFQDLERQTITDQWLDVTGGNGQKIPTPPPPRRPWYKNGRMVSAGTLGVIGGILVATRK